MSNLDLVSCRNVLIYLEPEAQRKVLDLFAFALTAGAYLFMGRSDALTGREMLFETVSSEHRIFRRNGAPPLLVEFPAGPVQREIRRPPGVVPSAGRLDPRRLAELNQRVLLRHFSAGVVLVRRNGEIVHFFGPVNKYLEHPTGAATLTLADLADEHMARRLMPALRKSAEEGTTVTFQCAVVVRDNRSLRVNVTISPIPGPGQEDLLSVIFEEVGTPIPLAADQEPGDQTELFGEMQTELRASKEDYRAAATVPTYVGLCITTGASDAVTINQCTAEAVNLTLEASLQTNIDGP